MKVVAALLALTVLGACGENAGQAPVAGGIGAFAKGAIAKISPRKAKDGATGKAANPAARRAELQKAGKPILRVSSKALGQTGFLRVVDAKGAVLTWATPDGATFSQRNGVLIQTRGLGADLMSAKAPSVAQLQNTGTSYQRVYYFLGADDQGTRRTYDCSTAVAGRETIEIVGRSHTTTHLVETCTRGAAKLKNDYWMEGAMIRQSRQWVSGGIGHIEFARVID